MTSFVACISLFLLFATFGKLSTNQFYHHHQQPSNLPSSCGKTRFDHIFEDEDKNRIINGTPARLGMFPWTVRVGTKRETSLYSKIHFHCGGSLISKIFVVSAAHCSEFGNIARVGQTYETNGVECDQVEIEVCAPPYQDIKIKKYIFEDYCRESHRNDLMLIELKTPAVFNRFVQPICLPPTSFSVSHIVGKKIAVSGWGRQNGTDPESASNKLLYIHVPVLDPEECALNFTDFDSKKQLCLAKFQGKIVCRGDSGSGVFDFMSSGDKNLVYLVGVVSYGKRGYSFHSVQTSVAYYLNSILTHIDNVRDD